MELHQFEVKRDEENKFVDSGIHRAARRGDEAEVQKLLAGVGIFIARYRCSVEGLGFSRGVRVRADQVAAISGHDVLAGKLRQVLPESSPESDDRTMRDAFVRLVFGTASSSVTTDPQVVSSTRPLYHEPEDGEDVNADA